MALGAVTSAIGAASEAVPTASPASVTSPAATTYQPKAGETLDQVIAKTMPSSPLSMGILRQAFIDQNPQAIIAGKVPKLRKGALLAVPDHALLLRGVLASVTPVAVVKEVASRPTPSTPEERKRWVQFP
jgi:Tfp pilus assembly protein FimV